MQLQKKKSASCTPQIGHLASYITYKTFCSCQVQTTVPKHIFKNTETAPCAKIFMVHECVILGVDRPHPALKAAIAFTFRTILKINSTKKVRLTYLSLSVYYFYVYIVQ